MKNGLEVGLHGGIFEGEDVGALGHHLTGDLRE